RGSTPSTAKPSGRTRSRDSSGREMFTGIVTDIGEVVAVEPRAQGLVGLKIACGYDADTIAVGASIACSGVCLTVVAPGQARARASGARGNPPPGRCG